MKSESEVAQSCLTLSMDCSLPGSSIHGIFQAKVLEWGAIAFSRLVHIYTGIFLLLEMKRFYLEKRKVKNCLLVSCCLPNELPQIWCFCVCVCVCIFFFFISFLRHFILFLNFTILYWFCQISKWIHHRYTCVPHPVFKQHGFILIVLEVKSLISKCEQSDTCPRGSREYAFPCLFQLPLTSGVFLGL